VVDVTGKDPLIGESTIPFSRIAPFLRFEARSEGGSMAVRRLHNELTGGQELNVLIAARQRVGIFYDTGFDLHSRRQFCSRFVREVLQEATRETVGEVETFDQLLSRHPKTDLSFWNIWYFGYIPWERQTITPPSLLHKDFRPGLDIAVGVALRRLGPVCCPLAAERDGASRVPPQVSLELLNAGC
jgi:hypothetical protein